MSSVGDDLEQLNALLSGDAPAQGFYGGFGESPHRMATRPGGGSSASGSVTDDLEQLNALLTADDPSVSCWALRCTKPILHAAGVYIASIHTAVKKPWGS